MEQLDLFPLTQTSSKDKTIAEAFDDFHCANPHVYRNLRFLALQAVRAGRRKLGIKLLFERLRWEYFVNTAHADDFSLNNNYTAYYARMLMDNEPELAGMFETRIMKSMDGERRIIVKAR